MPFLTPQADADARCIDCDHALAGLPEPRCPECGRTFRFDDAETWTTHAVPRADRRWQSPPSWFTFSFLGSLAAWYTWRCSALLIDEMEHSLFTAVSILVAGGYLLLRSIPAVYAAILRARAKQPQPRHALLRWTAALAIPALTAVLAVADLPRTLRWKASEPALRAHAQAALSSPSPGATHRSVTLGLITITSTEVRNGHVFLRTTFHSYPLNVAELVYSPPGQAPIANSETLDERWSMIVVEAY